MLAAVLLAGFGRGTPVAAATLAQCQEVLAALPGITAATVDVRGEDCLYRDVTVAPMPVTTWHADEVTVGRFDPDAIKAGQPPRSLNLVATGIVFRPRTPNAVANYIASVTAKPIEIRLDFEFVANAGSLRLNRFSMGGPAFGTLELSGELRGVDPADLAGGRTDTAERVGLAALDLSLDNRGLFESFAVPPLAGALLGDSPDPALTVEQLKAGATAQVTGLLTQAGSAPSTIEAMNRLIASLPHPSGRFTLHAAFPVPLTAAEFMSLGSDAPDPAALRKLAMVAAAYPGP